MDFGWFDPVIACHLAERPLKAGHSGHSWCCPLQNRYPETARGTRGIMMALTKDFKDSIQARVLRDTAFRKALLQEGVECLLSGDVDTGKAVLRDYINATIGFEELSRVFDKSSKSLMRIFGPKGNPQASNLFAVIGYLQEQEGIHLEVKARKVA